MEGLTGLTPPPRAKYIRVIMAELERLHSHVLWAGIAAKLMGFKTMFMTCFELREKVMDVLQAISGNRVNYSMNRIGGVNRDITDPPAILALVEALEAEMARTVIPIFTTSSTARSRCAGIGVLTMERAISCGVVGPVARASGLPQDLRRAAPYAAYEEMEFDVPVQPDGDVRARLLVRWPSCRPVKSTRKARSSPLSRERPLAASRRHVGKSCTASPGKRVPETRPECMCARLPLLSCQLFAGWCKALGWRIRL
jgi:Ni,Fe-hydrogenase III large subunit